MSEKQADLILESFLKKRGPTILYRWQSRWCVLRMTQESDKKRFLLEYYDKKGSRWELKGSINILPESKATSLQDRSAPGEAVKHYKEHPHGFVFDYDPNAGSGRRLFYFSAENAELLDKWLEALKSASNDLTKAVPKAGVAMHQHPGLGEINWKTVVPVPQRYRRQTAFVQQTERRALTLQQFLDIAELTEKVLTSMEIVDSNQYSYMFGKPITWDNVNLYHIDALFVRPLTFKDKCSFMEMVADGPQDPKWFTSHWWGTPFKDSVAMLELHAQALNSGSEVNYWMCLYANNQHKLEELQGEIKDTPFWKAIMLGSCVGTLKLLNERCEVEGVGPISPFTRIWCVLEDYVSLVPGKKKKPRQRFDVATMISEGTQREHGCEDGDDAAFIPRSPALLRDDGKGTFEDYAPSIMEFSPDLKIIRPHPDDMRAIEHSEGRFEVQETWITVGAHVEPQLQGRFYHEVKFTSEMGWPQVGWLTTGFKSDGDWTRGVGDTRHGWAADGQRHQNFWNDNATEARWPREWTEGDVIGCAVDLKARVMRFSLNGEYVDEVTLEMESEASLDDGLFPAASLKGSIAMHISKNEWQFSPPDDDYKPWPESSSKPWVGGGFWMSLIKTGGFFPKEVAQVGVTVKLEEADASNPSDKENILRLIGDDAPKVNEAVRQVFALQSMKSACKQGDVKALKVGLEEYRKLSTQDVQMSLSGDLLCMAAAYGDVNCVRLLLDLKADPLVKNSEGDDPVWCAAHEGARAAGALRVLLEAKGDPNCTNVDGCTALKIASDEPISTKTIFVLLDFGAGGFKQKPSEKMLEQLSRGDFDDLAWRELSKDQRLAARVLGYTQQTWDEGEGDKEEDEDSVYEDECSYEEAARPTWR